MDTNAYRHVSLRGVKCRLGTSQHGVAMVRCGGAAHIRRSTDRGTERRLSTPSADYVLVAGVLALHPSRLVLGLRSALNSVRPGRVGSWNVAPRTPLAPALRRATPTAPVTGDIQIKQSRLLSWPPRDDASAGQRRSREGALARRHSTLAPSDLERGESHSSEGRTGVAKRAGRIARPRAMAVRRRCADRSPHRGSSGGASDQHV